MRALWPRCVTWKFVGVKVHAQRHCDFSLKVATCATTANSGHLHVLIWLRGKDFPWDQRCYSCAMYRNHLHVAQWCQENGLRLAETKHKQAQQKFEKWKMQRLAEGKSTFNIDDLTWAERRRLARMCYHLETCNV